MKTLPPLDQIAIRPLADDVEAELCARMMELSEPWLSLGTGYRALFDLMQNPARERYVAWLDNRIAGFVVINMCGTLVSYIQTLCVAPGNRASGIGRLLMAHAEMRIFRDTPNVFLMVSDFNAAARRFYERLGYLTIGEVPELLVAGRSEILMRKTSRPDARTPDKLKGLRLIVREWCDAPGARHAHAEALAGKKRHHR
jgi:ribosomal protein S18 acetylase RimI-like enzyme